MAEDGRGDGEAPTWPRATMCNVSAYRAAVPSANPQPPVARHTTAVNGAHLLIPLPPHCAIVKF